MWFLHVRDVLAIAGEGFAETAPVEMFQDDSHRIRTLAVLALHRLAYLLCSHLDIRNSSVCLSNETKPSRVACQDYSELHAKTSQQVRVKANIPRALSGVRVRFCLRVSFFPHYLLLSFSHCDPEDANLSPLCLQPRGLKGSVSKSRRRSEYIFFALASST